MDFFATTAKGLEHLLEEELIQLGASSVKMTRAGVYFSGDLHTAYTVCLWSRVANHVLMPLVSFSAEDPETLYTAAQTLHWLSHFEADVTLRIDVVGTHASINNTQFIAQKIKDAIVDQIRAETQTRPTIQLDQPDIALHTFVQGHDFTISLSLSGESLHKRGYRLEGGRAPLKETLAAGILKRAGWEEQAKSEHPCLIDPMCGSGTLLIEAALMAYDIAPLLNRSYFGFLKWKAHDHSIWEALIEEATARRAKKLQAYRADIRGYDNHPKAIATARANIQRAGLSEFISVAVQDVTQISGLSLSHEKGLIVMNPPYGERLQPGEEAELKALFQRIGHHFQKEFLGWELAIFTAVPEWMKSLDIRTYKIYKLFNGALPAELLKFHLTPEFFMRHETYAQKLERRAEALLSTPSAGSEMFKNRLQKNLKHLKKWAQREGVFCYRIYDADLPEYAVAIDYYEDWVHIQEYQAPRSIDPQKAEQRLFEIIGQTHRLLNLPYSQFSLRSRQRQKGIQQYEKLDDLNEFHIAREGKAQFYVNFTNYLDTGLFLDHRLMRQKVAEASKGKALLNLFAYTCTASVHAALAGAESVTSVDLSNTYLEWGRRNFLLNHLPLHSHRFIQADCLQWLEFTREQFDVIFLDPPTFSNSKRMEGTLDIQRDHVDLIHQTLKHLKPGGVLYFSTNFRQFKLNAEALSPYQCKDISQQVLPQDFERRPNIHHCYEIR